jgi:outer membrane protein assembly factor BamB
MNRHTIRAALALAFLSASVTTAADWPQWRGPDRSNVSKESGLIGEWPKDGPPLAWKAAGLGDGVAPVSVASGRVFTTGNVDKEVVCTALSAKDGKSLWSAKLGPAANESSVMRWLAQMAPTVDGERVYAVTANGDYVCLAADTGKELWRKHYVKDFEGKKGTGWGFCDYPLVDGERLIVCPGGEKNTVAALDKKTGKLLWSCPIPGEAASHSVLVAAEVGGVRQYVVHLWKGMYAISAEGKLLWKYEGLRNTVANTHAPIAQGGEVFFANGYATGHALLRPAKKGGEWAVEEVYRRQAAYVPWLGSPTRVGDRVFVNNQAGMVCLDWKTGEKAWEERLGRVTYTVADGKLFVRTQAGKVILAAADPKEYKQLAEFAPPRPDKGAPAWTFPVVADGRLYVRDYDVLLCYDVRDPEARKKKAPDAVFVPTPPDVVARMLDLAAVKKGDVVYDLGSGDGRVVVAAAKAHGCRAVGVEIDKELVALSRRRAKEAGVEKLVSFEDGDLFEADFSDATVVALYVLPSMSQKLIPKFDKLKAGSRIVSHCFAIPGVVPDQVVRVTSEEDDVERPVYLYTVPLTREKPRGR